MYKKVFAIFLATLFLGLGLFYIREMSKIGTEVDSYKGVPVYYNGLLYTRSYGKHYSIDGYYYGQKWQCVEYIKRFFFDAKNHRMPDVMGNARDFFDSTLQQGEKNKRRGLFQYKNGGNVKPKVDDLLVFTDTKYGHVAIVTKVDTNSIEVIQQNIYGKPRAIFHLKVENGNYYVGKEKKPAGWLRK